MAGRKLSSKVAEEVVFMESLLLRIDALARPIEEYATAKKNAESYSQQVTRALSEMRQHAMMKNLGPVADAAGGLGVQCSRGSQLMRTRTMREGVAALKQLIERTMKASIDADLRHRAEEEKQHAIEQAARDRTRAAVERARAAAAAVPAADAPAPRTPDSEAT